MTIQFPKWLPYSQFAMALAMVVALYLGVSPKLWGWLLFLPLFLVIMYEGLRTFTYSLTIGDDRIVVRGFKPGEYPISEIMAVDVWFAKGGRMGVVTFEDRSKLSFHSSLVGFDQAVELLRTKAGLPEPAQQA